MAFILASLAFVSVLHQSRTLVWMKEPTKTTFLLNTVRFDRTHIGENLISSVCLAMLMGTNGPTTGELLSIINGMNQTLQTVVQENEGQKMEIASLKGSHQLTQVAFSVVLSRDIQLGDHQPIEFDHIITNIGNGYDVRHGHFTAPMKGLYMFTITIMTNPKHNLHVQIVKNGAELIRVYSDLAEYGDASNTVFAELNIGDMVWAMHMGGASQEIKGGLYSSFGGALLK